MKKIITSAAFAAFIALAVNPLYAGSGHDHDHGHSHEHTKTDEAGAKKVALKQLDGYVLNGKLEKSWQGTALKSVKEQMYHGKPEWVFAFHNAKVQSVDKQNLYIFVNQYGEVTGTNFTGK